MREDGIEDVLIQPTHIIHGFEYEKMMEQIEPYRTGFQTVRIGEPLLATMEDYEEAVRQIMEEAGLEQEETLVLMGHGTEHHTNAAYPALDYTFWAKGYPNVVVGTVEGFPEMDEVLKKLKERKAKNDPADAFYDCGKAIMPKLIWQEKRRIPGNPYWSRPDMRCARS